MSEQELGGTQDLSRQTPPRRRSRRGLWIVVAALIVVAVIVAAGIIPRERTEAELRSETYDLAAPTVSVFQPKRGAPAQEIVLPGTLQAFIDSPIYARTTAT